MFLNWKTQFTKEISYPKLTCLFSETQIKTPVGNFFLGGGGLILKCLKECKSQI